MEAAPPPGPTGGTATQVLDERRTSFKLGRRHKESAGGTERPAEPPRPSSDEVAEVVDTVTPSAATAGSTDQPAMPVPPASADQVEMAAAAEAVEEAEDTGKVDNLFARIRADRAKAVAEAGEVLADGTDADQGEAGPVAGATAAGTEVSNEDEALLQRRDEAIGTIEASLARKLKRVLQDEQNDLLDKLRGLRTQPTAAVVLPGREAHLERFAIAGRPLLAKAAAAGAAFMASIVGRSNQAAAEETTDLDDLTANLAAAIVDPLRRRLEQAFTDTYDDDPAVLAESLGSAYREWKTQRIEQTASDHVASAFARGAFASAPDGTVLRWVVEDVDGPCPDCDDNALAGGLTKGEPFPTGQRHPPAHAGCRCLLVVEA
jgi:hypothetical protein